jgi:hypothetical protein
MKKLLLLFGCISLFIAKAQNGFTTYTTNLSINGSPKFQTAFLVDNSLNKWIGYHCLTSGTNTANAGLVKYDNSTWTLYNKTSSPGFPSNWVTCLAKDNSGNIWIGCDSGLVKFDGTAFTTYNVGLPVKLINCVEAVGNQVYVGTNMGLSRFDGTTFTNYNVAGGTLPGNAVKSIKAETANIIWIGCNGNNLTKFTINASFTTTNYNDYATPGGFYCIYIDSQNDKWLGTDYGVLKFNGSSFQKLSDLYDINDGSVPAYVRDITTGPHNGILFIRENGIPSVEGPCSGFTELAANRVIYQYFTPVAAYNLGWMVENEGSNILVSGSPSDLPKAYYSFDPLSVNIAPLGTINNANFKALDINNVYAGIANRSDMHWKVGGSANACYEVPKGSGSNTNFATALWIGGLDNANQLHGAAQTYRQGGVDFWPGPLDTINATIDSATSINYDKIWKVSYTDINTFITAFNSGSVVATPDMLSWPAHGGGNNSRNLAPFVDYNGDGVYNPNDGDYPKIKGDQALYFIYNDRLSTQNHFALSMGIEVQGMAYAYGCPSVVTGHNELNYTTFYDYKIINRSSNNYHDVYVSMFSDADLGYYGDDYIGSDVGDNYGYIYNGDVNDETIAGTPGYGVYPPAQGFNIVKGPLANVNDGIDNNNNGIIDEIDEDCKLSSFTYYNNLFTGIPPGTGDPQTGQEFYNYMTGYWKDGTSFTCSGNGYNGASPTSYVYTADSYTNGVCGATPWYESTSPGDRRMMLSSGPFTLNAGQMQEVEYAFVTSFDSSSTINSNLLSVAKLKTDIQKINTFYNQLNKPNCLQAITIGVSELLKQSDFLLYPNPAKLQIIVSSTIIGNLTINYEVIDILGKVALQSENTGSEKFAVDISNLTPGIYFLRLQVNNSIVVKKFVKE